MSPQTAITEVGDELEADFEDLRRRLLGVRQSGDANGGGKRTDPNKSKYGGYKKKNKTKRKNKTKNDTYQKKKRIHHKRTKKKK